MSDLFPNPWARAGGAPVWGLVSWAWVLAGIVLSVVSAAEGGAPADPPLHDPQWVYSPPRQVAPPEVRDPAWVRNPIDRFVLARLEREGTAPSPEADRVTLIRRLSLDLTGLPPTTEEVDAFISDPGEDAYDRLVERLLASPHHGERWARHWLDAARYADSDGFEKDKMRPVWFYRDWVINAINRDLPYDQFIIEQIAGDLLPGATQDQRVATGFLRNSMTNEEGGIDPEQFRMEAMFDRMDAVGKSILGLTIQCAQCHDHKYDPISQLDYYRLFAFLNNANESIIAVYSAEEARQRHEVLAGIAAIEDALRARTPDWKERVRAWENETRMGEARAGWTVVRPVPDEASTGGQRYLPQDDGSFLAAGYAPTKHRVMMTVETSAESLSAVLVELLTHPDLPLSGPGRSVFGTAALTEIEVEAAPLDGSTGPVKAVFAGAVADEETPEAALDPVFDDRDDKKRIIGPARFAIDGDPLTAWGSDLGPGRRHASRAAVFRVAEPIRIAGGMRLTFFLSQNHGGWNSDDNQNHNLGRFRLSITGTPVDEGRPPSPRLTELLSISEEARTASDWGELFRFWRQHVPEWADENARIEAFWARHPAGGSQLAHSQREAPRMTRYLKRGDFLQPGDPVEPGVPAVLHAMDDGAAGGSEPPRLRFARWLVDRDSPTAARTAVNRLWQHYFGTGFVASSEDLGVQAEAPSHPDLLDWLAVGFMENGWRMKDLHRLVVGSATYRQASTFREDVQERDPYNRLLARGARFRVEGEIVRDIALAASGLLDRTVGGPSVFPPIPEFMLQPPVSYGPKPWTPRGDADRHRRGLYIFRYRSLPYPVLATFDAPAGDFSCVRRTRSNTPLQALVTLNEPVFLEAARALGRLACDNEAAAGSDAARLEAAFRRCVARAPSREESDALLEFLDVQRRRLDAGELDPAALTGAEAADEAGPDAARELAAWTTVARVLLNLDETLTRE